MITLSQTELKRMLVLQRVLEGQISTFETDLVLGLSERQVYRLKAKFQSQRPAALVHGNRGRTPVHAVPEETRQQVIQLAHTIYRGCNYPYPRPLTQAKGRVERAFGTLQERLTVELRLAGACSLEEANGSLYVLFNVTTSSLRYPRKALRLPFAPFLPICVSSTFFAGRSAGF